MAKHIEPLSPVEVFRVVVSGLGVYEMTKGEFYEAFPNVVASRSYRVDGLYHGANLHAKAARFRTSE